MHDSEGEGKRQNEARAREEGGDDAFEFQKRDDD